MNERIERLYNWSKGREKGPYKIELRYTKRCNLDCLSCWRTKYNGESLDYSKEISKERCLKIVEEAAELNVKEILLTGGGEPLIKKSLFDSVIEKIKKLNISGMVVTNGTLFDEQLIEKMVRINWDGIIFSVDGPDAKTNNLLRRGSKPFKKVLEALQHFNRYKEKYNSSLPKLSLSPVISNRNYHKLPEFVQFAAETNISDINFQLLVENNKVAELMSLNRKERKELHDLIPKSIELAKKRGISCNAESLYEEGLMKNNTSKGNLIKEDGREFSGDDFLSAPCYRPWYYISIHPDGSVQPCSNIPQKEEDYEDIDKKQMEQVRSENIKNKSLSEIWHGDYFKTYRRRILNKNIFPWCEICCGNEVFDVKEMRKKLVEKGKNELSNN